MKELLELLKELRFDSRLVEKIDTVNEPVILIVLSGQGI
jgi:hypothetical protein